MKAWAIFSDKWNAIWDFTIREKRQNAIKAVMRDSKLPWRTVKRNHQLRAVRVSVEIEKEAK
jgi:hypothetical protein